MVRTKHAASKGKSKLGKRGSSSHSRDSPTQRQRTDESPERSEKPVWGGGPLSGMPREWQLELFRDKMRAIGSKSSGYICERVIKKDDFASFGIVQYFQNLGWEAAMDFDEMRINRLYMDPIEEWVGSLRLVKGNNYPKTMSLVGEVAGVTVTMSRDTLKHIARFDTKASNQYVYPTVEVLYAHPTEQPNWNRMVEAVFEPGKGTRMLRNDLKKEAKLLLLFMGTNVMPRRGDKVSVRHPEVPILYSLLLGTPKIPFTHLAMMNIWEARNNKEKGIIPHCKLIQALLRWNEVLDDEYEWNYISKREVTYEIAKLRKSLWEYKQSERYHRLIDEPTNRIWDVLKEDARPLRIGEPDVFNSEAAVYDTTVGGGEQDSDDDDQPIGRMFRRSRGEGSSQRAQPQPQPQYTFQDRGTPWGVVDDDMQRIIMDARPSGWRDFPPYARVMFDQATQNSELQRREVHRVYERNEQWNTLHAYNVQREINHNFDDAQQRRMHGEWHSGQPVVQHPPVVDYMSLDPYDGSVRYPEPQVHHSEWLDPYQDRQQQQQQQQQGDGTPSVFSFTELENMMTGIFGPQRPRYY